MKIMGCGNHIPQQVIEIELLSTEHDMRIISREIFMEIYGSAGSRICCCAFDCRPRHTETIQPSNHDSGQTGHASPKIPSILRQLQSGSAEGNTTEEYNTTETH